MTVTQNLILVSILRGGIYALVSVGFSLTLGVMNISNFAHGEFYMLGAYAGYFAFTVLNLPPLVAMLLGALFSFGAGVLVEKSLLYRLRKMGERDWLVNSFLLTAGLSVVLQNLVQLVWGTTYRGIPQYWAGSLQLFPGVSIAMDRAASLLIACSAIVALWVFLSKTKTGRAIRAVAQDSTGAVLVGIDLDKMQTLAFAVGCALAGLAGAILLYMTPAFPGAGVFYLDKAWFVVILMGLGNVAAAIPGGFVVALLESVGFYLLGKGWQDVVTLGVLMLVLLFKPSGILGSKVKGALER